MNQSIFLTAVIFVSLTTEAGAQASVSATRADNASEFVERIYANSRVRFDDTLHTDLLLAARDRPAVSGAFMIAIAAAKEKQIPASAPSPLDIHRDQTLSFLALDQSAQDACAKVFQDHLPPSLPILEKELLLKRFREELAKDFSWGCRVTLRKTDPAELPTMHLNYRGLESSWDHAHETGDVLVDLHRMGFYLEVRRIFADQPDGPPTIFTVDAKDTGRHFDGLFMIKR